jgi:hypothetical protein
MLARAPLPAATGFSDPSRAHNHRTHTQTLFRYNLASLCIMHVSRVHVCTLSLP